MLKNDAIAGLSTALNQVPKALAFATLAGLPPEYGLYAAQLPPLIYVLFGSSPNLGLGPSALVCILTGNHQGYQWAQLSLLPLLHHHILCQLHH
jgi:SulP family sulfate permease